MRAHRSLVSCNNTRATQCHLLIAEFRSTRAPRPSRRQVVDEDAEPANESRKKQLIITGNRICKHCNTKSKRLFNDRWCGPRGGGSARDVSCSDPPRDERKVLRTGPPSSGRERVCDGHRIDISVSSRRMYGALFTWNRNGRSEDKPCC
jgi:hypothetical protein